MIWSDDGEDLNYLDSIDNVPIVVECRFQARDEFRARVVHMSNSQRALSLMRWGMPTSQKILLDAAKVRAGKLEAKGKTVNFKELLHMEPDKGVTNVRNTSSSHWNGLRDDA